jgi:hypothetical protein
MKSVAACLAVAALAAISPAHSQTRSDCIEWAKTSGKLLPALLETLELQEDTSKRMPQLRAKTTGTTRASVERFEASLNKVNAASRDLVAALREMRNAFEACS